MELQPILVERGPQGGEEEPAIEAGQHLHGQEKAWAAADPASPVGRWPTAGDDAVKMRVMLQVLPPGVEHGHQPDRRAEMLGVGGDTAQRLGRHPEQQAVDDGLVLEGDLGDRRRHGEHDMEVRHRQQLGLPVGQPGSPCQPLAPPPDAAA